MNVTAHGAIDNVRTYLDLAEQDGTSPSMQVAYLTWASQWAERAAEAARNTTNEH
jgi:hypothetical protein